MAQRLRLMWDYGAFPLWNLDQGGMMSRLPLSEDLRNELQAWSDEWTDLVWGPKGPDTPGAVLPSQDQYDDWNRRGHEFGRRLTDELGGEYEIVFWEEPVGGDEEE